MPVPSRPVPRFRPPARPGFVLMAVCLLAATAVCRADRPDPRPIPPDANALTDEKIGESIKKGSDWLYGQLDPQTHVVTPAAVAAAAKVNAMPAPGGDAFSGGLDALAVYSLMQCGLAMPDDKRLSMKGPEVKAMVAALCKQDLSKGHPQTYAHALRSTALSLYVSGLEDTPKAVTDEDRKCLQEDAVWCLSACDGGAYTYGMRAGAPNTVKALAAYYATLKPNNLPKPVGAAWDNSNGQYGLLGVWSASEAGALEVPPAYWALVDNQWTTHQLRNGIWDYGKGLITGDDTLAMACAGLASCLVTHDYLNPVVLSGRVNREPFSPAVKKGLEWFEEGDHAVNLGQPTNWWGYTLYGVERVGLASGFKHFGKHDWYREIAEVIVKYQNPDGSWFGDPVNTSYALLFLARGRHPLVMNKLRYDGFWANRPRDAFNLAHHISKVVERR